MKTPAKRQYLSRSLTYLAGFFLIAALSIQLNFTEIFTVALWSGCKAGTEDEDAALL